MKKRILILFTGGTIAMRHTDKGFAPVLNTEEFLNLFPQIKSIAEVDILKVANIDSTYMQPKIWKQLASEIQRNFKDYDGFVITHGTDTMAYSASALSFMLTNLSKPVVFTGSQKGPEELASDAHNNIINATLVATMDIPDVLIVFGTDILRGNRSQKKSDLELNAFWSPNVGRIGKIDIHPKIFTKYPKPKTNLKIAKVIEERIISLNIFPGINSDVLLSLLNKNIKGIVLNSFGPGHIPVKLLTHFLYECKKDEIPVVLTKQCIEGSGDIDLLNYEVGMDAKKYGIISARDMTIEAATTKLMYILGQTKKIEKIRELFAQNLAGEVSI